MSAPAAIEHAGAAGHPFWTAIFGVAAPVEIEIGPGDGAFLLAAVPRSPATNFLAIERSAARVRRLTSRLAALATPRIRLLHADARCVVSHLVPPASVAAYHVYFPDPWPKRRHAPRRLITPATVAALARSLMEGGRLWFATDVAAYAATVRARVLADGRFEEWPVGPDHPGLGTKFARKYRAEGRPLYPASFVRLDSSARPPRAAAAASKIRSS